MKLFATLFGIALIALVLWEGFETIVLPRRVTRRFRLTRLFYRLSWRVFRRIVSVLPARSQDTWLAYFGPLSLVFLLCLWASGLIVGYALLQWGQGQPVFINEAGTDFLTDLYFSGSTFFTLGLGDVVSRNSVGHALTILESGTGLGFLALIIGYLPALNTSFSAREVSISLLDARAGSPPTAYQMLRRHGHERGMEALRQLLFEWERWSAELLEGHLSYPVLAYFRSQHDNQSWLGALAAILDTCALVMAGVEGACVRQAELTFAMARHATVDLSIVFATPPRQPEHERLSSAQLAQMREELAASGIHIHADKEAEERLTELRQLYEPYLVTLARYFHVVLPPWIPEKHALDNWQASIWDTRPAARSQVYEREKGQHF